MRFQESTARVFATIGIIALQILVGCSNAGSDAPTTPPNVATLRIVSGRTVDDTAFAVASIVAVEYTDATGAKKAGVPLHFELVLDSATNSALLQPRVSLVTGFDTTTDVAGRATTGIVFLSKAGTGYVRATAKGTVLADSIPVVVRPAKTFRIAVSPYDTAMLISGSVQLTARSLDRFGNVRPDVVSWSSSASEVSVNATGRVTATQFARAKVLASANGVTDSSFLSVVPQGTIAASWMSPASGGAGRLEMFETDGSKRSEIPIAVNPACGAMGLAWRAAGDSILFTGACFDSHVMKATLPGVQSQIALSSSSVSETWPAYSNDGQFIYFTARPGHQNGEIWRMRADGSAPTRVGAAVTDFFDLDRYPSVSRDGSTVVFSSNRKYRATERPTIAFIDVASGVVRESGLEGEAPRWSPQNDRIAFHTNGKYAVANADGSGLRLLSPSHSTIFQDPPSWSPDGRWIVTVGVDPKASAPLYGRLEIINVQSGLVLPLAWTSSLTFPAWRP